MDRLYRPESIRKEPLITIAWILAIFAIIGGLYIISPLLVLDTPTGAVAIYHILGSGIGLLLLGLTSIASGIVTIAGIIKNKVRWIANGLFMNFIIRMYALLAAFVIFGLDTSWISSITIMLITLVCYFVLKAKG